MHVLKDTKGTNAFKKVIGIRQPIYLREKLKVPKEFISMYKSEIKHKSMIEKYNLLLSKVKYKKSIQSKYKCYRHTMKPGVLYNA